MFQLALAQSVSQILKMLFQFGHINTFVLSCVIFTYIFKKKKKTRFSKQKKRVSETFFNVAKHEIKTS